MFCGEAEQPQTFISETSYVKVLFHTDNFTDQVRCNPATRQPGSPASRTLSFLSSSSHIRSRWDFSFLRSSQERIPITAGATKTGILEALPSVVGGRGLISLVLRLACPHESTLKSLGEIGKKHNTCYLSWNQEHDSGFPWT